MFYDEGNIKDASMFTKVARIEEWATSTERRLKNLEEQNMSLSKLSSSFELMQRLEEERQKRQYLVDQQQHVQQEKFSMTLEKMDESFKKINESMQQLNSSNKDTNHKIDNIEVVVAGVKAKVDQMEEDDTINWKKGFKTLGGVFITAIVVSVATYVATTIGFK